MALLTIASTGSSVTRARAWLSLAFACCLLVLGACTTMDAGPPPKLESNARWTVLPFVNHTETPQAGLRAESIAENILRAGGVAKLTRYPSSLNTETLFEPMDRKQRDEALEWARRENIRYALAGGVDEWRYKVGIDGEPAVGLTLQVIDVGSGDVLWASAAGGTGWSREALSALAQKLLRSQLAPVIRAAR